MKTLHLSSITGIGIVMAIIAGISIMIFPSFIFLNEYNPSCIPAPNTSREMITLKHITWLGVMEIEKNQTKLDCTLVNHYMLSSNPKLEEALVGADQCKQGNDDICSFASGVSVEMVPLGITDIIPVQDNVNYQATLTNDEANSLLSNVRLVSNANLTVGDIQYGNKYYQVILWTSNEPNSSIVRASYNPEPHYLPDDLAKGESKNYTITVKTLATFGNLDQVQLYPVITAQDSGLSARIVPDTLYIPERSQANSTLVVAAGPDAQNGTYPIGFSIKIPNGGVAGGINPSPCPCIRIGNSDWTIRTYGSNGYGGMGGNQPPEWLQIETHTDKQIYHAGETVEIKNFIVNDSPNKIILNDTRLFVNVYNQVNDTGSFRYFYGIDAYDENSLVLEPHSKSIIARPFYWDQSDLRDQSVSHKVMPGDYHIDVSFGSYNGAVWDNDIPIVIR